MLIACFSFIWCNLPIVPYTWFYDCEYLNEQLIVTGDISFKIGEPEKTTYIFTEAFIDNDKIRLQGTNKRFDLNEKFNIVGHIEKESKMFITESFK